MSKRRLRDADAATAEAKKYKSAVDTMADEFICPINLEKMKSEEWLVSREE